MPFQSSLSSREHGFSLIELLIVVAIVGIIAAIAIPNLLATRRAANEASAVSSIRSLVSAEVAYYATLGQGNFALLGELSEAGFIDSVLGGDNVADATSVKSGYEFKSTIVARNQATGVEPTFVLSGIPLHIAARRQSGARRFGTDTPGAIFNDRSNLNMHYETTASLSAGTSKSLNN